MMAGSRSRRCWSQNHRGPPRPASRPRRLPGNSEHNMGLCTPGQDTPARLTAYARKFHAGPEWQYYTGTVAASIVAQRAFDVYRGEKMSHTPVTLMRAGPGKPWLRIEGFVTPDELVDDYRNLLAS